MSGKAKTTANPEEHEGSSILPKHNLVILKQFVRMFNGLMSQKWNHLEDRKKPN